MRPPRVVVAVAVPLTLVLAGCGGSSNKSSSSSASSSATTSAATTPPATTPPATTPPAAGHAITIKNFDFSPKPITVSAGSTVTVANADGTAHTVTSDDKKSFDTKHVNSGKTTTFTAPTQAGTYAYHCSIHSGMHGSLVVQ